VAWNQLADAVANRERSLPRLGNELPSVSGYLLRGGECYWSASGKLCNLLRDGKHVRQISIIGPT